MCWPEDAGNPTFYILFANFNLAQPNCFNSGDRHLTQTLLSLLQILYYVPSSYEFILIDATILLQINVSQNHQLPRKDLSALVFSQVQVIIFLLPYTWDSKAQGQSEKMDESK